jgi:hypothetical protein
MKFIVAWLVLFCSACAHMSGAEKQAYIDCTEQEIASQVPQYVGLVSFIISGAQQDPNWLQIGGQGLQMLIALEQGRRDVIACAAAKLRQDPSLAVDATAQDTRTAFKGASPSLYVSGADEYIRNRGFRFKGAR